MNEKQISVIRCAYADLQGVLQAEEAEQLNASITDTIDTIAIRETVAELKESFPFLVESDEESSDVDFVADYSIHEAYSEGLNQVGAGND
jgi:hypothetical protein